MKLFSRFKHRCPYLYRVFAKIRFTHAGESIVNLPLGFKVVSNPYSYVETEIKNGRFENNRASFLKSVLLSHHVFIDIGSNIGFYSLLAASMDCTVHSFEPDRHNVRRLKRNIAVNGFQKLVEVNSVALGETQCRLPIYAPLTDNYGRVSLVKDDASVACDMVEVNTLDSVLAVPDESVLIKIDVEGFEEKVLLGASRWLASVKKGSLWVIEVHQGLGVELSSIRRFFPEYTLSLFDDATGSERSIDDPPSGDPILLARR